jgi:hypothetical protein
MISRKHIYWRPDMNEGRADGMMFANVHVLGDYAHTIIQYRELIEELRKTFPEARDCEVYCERIIKSGTVNGFAIVTYNAWIPRKEYPGWYERTWETDKGGPEYSWR